MARTPPARRLTGLVAASGSALASLALAAPVLAVRAAPGAPRDGLRGSPIAHVVEIMLENHTYDSLFGEDRRAGGIPAGATFPDPADPGARVAALTAPPNEGDVQGGLNNTRAAELAMMDRRGGRFRMDGYTLFPGEGLSSITTFPAATDPDLQYLARHFELADRNFQPVIAPTLPNVLDALAGTSHGQLTNAVPDTGSWISIFDELQGAHRSWGVFSGVPTSVFAGTVWTRLLPAGSSPGIAPVSQLLTDLTAGTLPDLSFVRPGVGYSEEPPEDVGEGDAWLGQLVEAVARSRYWRSTAIFVTYDEGGGFYDHVAPPVVPGGDGYGTRTPLVIVSPWVRTGVYRATTTNLSVLSFMEHLWGLAPLTALDARQNDLAGAFDFRRHPLAPPAVPVDPPETIGFYGSSILADVGSVVPGAALTVNLQESTPGLALDAGVAGTATLTLTPPAGVPEPAGFPSAVRLARGTARITLVFARAGYYRIRAAGPGGSLGWLTVDVGVTPDTP